jgi:hypothetical protein
MCWQRRFLTAGSIGILSLLVSTVSASPAAAPSGAAAGPSIASVTIEPAAVAPNSTAGVVTSCTWHSTANPSCITSPGASATGTVTLTAPAPPGGAVIGLSVSGSRSCVPTNPVACTATGAWVPWAVFIPAGHVQAMFPVYAEKFQRFGFTNRVPCIKFDPVTHVNMGMGWCDQPVEGRVQAVVQAAYAGAARSATLSVGPGLDQPPPACSGGSNPQFFGGIESGQYAPIPAGRVGQSYSAQLFQGGRDPSAVLSGGPGGLQLSKTGVLSGVPAVPGAFKLNIQVTESCGGKPRFATATLEITETTPPQISSVTLTPNPLPANGGEVTLSVRASDNVGVARVLLTQIKPSGEQNSGIVPPVAGTPTNGEWRTQWRIAGNSGMTAQTYTIKVTVNDAAGNAVEAPPIQLTVAGGSAGPSGTTPSAPGFQPPGGANAPQGSQAQSMLQPPPLQRTGALPPPGPVVGQGQQTGGSGQSNAPDWWVLRPATAQDAPLAQSLNAQLQQNSRGWAAAARTVSVEVANGAVRLTGRLPTVQERASIETAVRSTQGVRSVTNAIMVAP